MPWLLLFQQQPSSPLPTYLSLTCWADMHGSCMHGMAMPEASLPLSLPPCACHLTMLPTRQENSRSSFSLQHIPSLPFLTYLSPYLRWHSICSTWLFLSSVCWKHCLLHALSCLFPFFSERRNGKEAKSEAEQWRERPSSSGTPHPLPLLISSSYSKPSWQKHLKNKRKRKSISHFKEKAWRSKGKIYISILKQRTLLGDRTITGLKKACSQTKRQDKYQVCEKAGR